jgi:glyoxylase-like metal-dependent hydrolase (beta-lactamase superfamily II)
VAPRPKKQEQDPASTEVVEVAPNVLRMQLPIYMPGLGHVNMYGLVDDRGLAVVDPGLPGPSSWRAIKARLKTAGFKLKDIHTVIVTHSHPDHFGGAGRIAQTTGAEIITHAAFMTWSLSRKDRRVIEHMTSEDAAALERQAAKVVAELDLPPGVIETALDEAERRNDPLRSDEDDTERTRTSVPWGGDTPWGGSKHPEPGFKHELKIRALRLLFAPPDPTKRVRHADRIQLAGREWRALHTPGHTLDHLCLYDPEHGLVLSGDHILPSITPHISGVGNGGDALRSYLATLDLVAHLDNVKLGLPAHGHPFDDVPGRVDAIKRHHEERMEQIRAVSLAIGPATVQSLSHELFPARHWGVMAESETFAHLEHLRLEGQAESWNDEKGNLLFQAAPA